MAKFAVLDNTTGAAGTVTNVVLGNAPVNAGWINIDAETDPISSGWTFDGVSTFTFGVPEGGRTLDAIVTDVKINAVSVFDPDNNNYTMTTSDIFDVVAEIRNKSDGAINPVNDTRTIILAGIFGTIAVPVSVPFVAGIATLTFSPTIPGVWELNDETQNFTTALEADRADLDRVITVSVTA